MIVLEISVRYCWILTILYSINKCVQLKLLKWPLPLQCPPSVWSFTSVELKVWTQSASSSSFWIIPQMLICSKAHWSRRVWVAAGRNQVDMAIMQVWNVYLFFVFHAQNMSSIICNVCKRELNIITYCIHTCDSVFPDQERWSLSAVLLRYWRQGWWWLWWEYQGPCWKTEACSAWWTHNHRACSNQL